MKSKRLIGLLGLGLLAFTLRGQRFLPLTLSVSPEVLRPLPASQGLIRPLAALADSLDDTAAFLVLDPNDRAELPTDLPPGRVLITTNPAVLRALFTNCVFHPVGGDLTTVTSSLLVRRRGRVVFRAGLILDTTQIGLQSPQFGWAKSVNPQQLRRVFRRFHAANPLLVTI